MPENEFKPLTNAFPDANFSIVEQNRSKTFTVEALSEDPSFPVTEVSLSSNKSDNDNKYFQSVSSNSNNSLTFEFENPPDYESPLDSDGDNDYVVSIEAQCDGNQTIEFFTIRVTDDPYSQLVINPRPQDKGKSSNSLSDQELKENQSYVLQLDVNDSEKKDEYKDLLFLTSKTVGFVPQTPQSVGELGISAQFIPEDLESIESDGNRKVLAADFRNIGANDLIVLLTKHPTPAIIKI